MKRTPTTLKPSEFPVVLHPFLQNARAYDSSCSPEARVWLLEKDCGYFLKRAPKGALLDEAQMTRHFHALGLSTEVILFHAEGEFDYLLTARIPGEDATHAQYLADPKRLCDAIATELRALHERGTKGCPIADHSAKYLTRATENRKSGVFDRSFLPPSLAHMTADEAWELVQAEGHRLTSDTLLHGDYCLPNILFDDRRFSGFIDLGNGGVGDRHVDLFWGAWTLAFNLGTDHYRDRFFDAYGRDVIDEDRIALIGAIECFG